MTSLLFNSSAASDGVARELLLPSFPTIRIPQRADEIAETLVWQARNESRPRDGTTDAGAAHRLTPILTGDGFGKWRGTSATGHAPESAHQTIRQRTGRIISPNLRRMCDVYATDPCRKIGDRGIRLRGRQFRPPVGSRQFSLESLK